METVYVRTKLFPTDDGIEESNDIPGKHLAAWIREKLTGFSYDCDDVISEDYGWGFWLKKLNVWIAVGPCEEPGQKTAAPEWAISANFDPAFNFKLWFKKREGQAMARKVLSDITLALRAEPAISVLDRDLSKD